MADLTFLVSRAYTCQPAGQERSRNSGTQDGGVLRAIVSGASRAWKPGRGGNFATRLAGVLPFLGSWVARQASPTQVGRDPVLGGRIFAGKMAKGECVWDSLLQTVILLCRSSPGPKTGTKQLVSYRSSLWHIIFMVFKSFVKNHIFRDKLWKLSIKICLILLVGPTETPNQNLRTLPSLVQSHKYNGGPRVGKWTSNRNHIFQGKHYCLSLREISIFWHLKLCFENRAYS